MKQEHFLSLAKEASKKSDHHTHKLGAVIVRKNRVLGVGHNMMKTHPKSPHKFHSTHAEFLAILNSGYDVKGATIYVYRQHKNGKPSMSRPCQCCLNFLIENGIKNVVYSFEGTYVQEKIK